MQKGYIFVPTNKRSNNIIKQKTMKAKENMIIKAMRMQAEAIMNNNENSWIDSPEKLMIATIYNMAKGGIIDKMMD